jgi:hypothetical protein
MSRRSRYVWPPSPEFARPSPGRAPTVTFRSPATSIPIRTAAPLALVELPWGLTTAELAAGSAPGALPLSGSIRACRIEFRDQLHLHPYCGSRATQLPADRELAAVAQTARHRSIREGSVPNQPCCG